MRRDSPGAIDDLREAWHTRGIDFQRLLIGLLIDTITVKPGPRANPRVFDDSRLDWQLRV